LKGLIADEKPKREDDPNLAQRLAEIEQETSVNELDLEETNTKIYDLKSWKQQTADSIGKQ
jgi:hypothetical protein